MLGTTMPTPLYPLYQQQLRFSELLITVIYAVYAGGVLVALLAFGELSDRVGRRRALLPGLAASALSAVAFLVEGGLPALFVGRVLSGLSAGIFTGTATATLLDLVPVEDRRRATQVATLVNMGGLGLGPLLSGVVSQYIGLPLRTIFVLDLVLLVPAAIAVARMPEPVEDTQPFRLHLTALSVPPLGRATFVRAAIVGFAGFVVLGFFTAVMPSALEQLMVQHNRAVIGAIVSAVFAASVAGQAAMVAVGEVRALPLGCGLLIAGMGLLAGALQTHAILLLVLGALVAGIGQGLSFRAGLTLVGALAAAGKRSEVTSAFFALLYVGISIPVIGVGLAAQTFGLQPTGIVTAAIVAALAALVLVALLARPPTLDRPVASNRAERTPDRG